MAKYVILKCSYRYRGFGFALQSTVQLVAAIKPASQGLTTPILFPLRYKFSLTVKPILKLYAIFFQSIYGFVAYTLSENSAMEMPVSFPQIALYKVLFVIAKLSSSCIIVHLQFGGNAGELLMAYDFNNDAMIVEQKHTHVHTHTHGCVCACINRIN